MEAGRQETKSCRLAFRQLAFTVDNMTIHSTGNLRGAFYTMKMLVDRIRKDARHLGGGMIRTLSFLNHNIDAKLMKAIGEELARLLASTRPTKILTAETSGIMPALALGMVLEVDVVFARKHRPLTMVTEPLRELSVSPTHGSAVELLVDPEFMRPDDRILVIDDFLNKARTIRALVNLIVQSGGTLVGIGVVIEKVFSGGRVELQDLAVPIHSLAAITGYEGERLILADCA
jgi:xanthine phosphoribosyltransferase